MAKDVVSNEGTLAEISAKLAIQETLARYARGTRNRQDPSYEILRR